MTTPGLRVAATAAWHAAVLAVVSTRIVPPTVGVVAAVTGGAYAAAVTAALAVAAVRSGHAPGPADAVTAARSGLVAGVAALVAAMVTGPVSAPVTATATALAVVALVLDGVDGVVARRTGTASPGGARFDMEVDAALIAFLAVGASLVVGPWVLLVGAMRYLHGVASLAVPALRLPLPASRARKVVAAVQGVVLTVTVSHLLPGGPAAIATCGALAALVWSFGRDVVRQAADAHRRRPSEVGAPARGTGRPARGADAARGRSAGIDDAPWSGARPVGRPSGP